MNSGRMELAGNLTKTKLKTEIKKKWIAFLLEGVREIPDEQDALTVLSDRIKDNDPDFKQNERNDRLIKNLYTLYKEMLVRQNNAEDIDRLSEAVMQSASQRGLRLPEAREQTELDAVISYLART